MLYIVYLITPFCIFYSPMFIELIFVSDDETMEEGDVEINAGEIDPEETVLSFFISCKKLFKSYIQFLQKLNKLRKY